MVLFIWNNALVIDAAATRLSPDIAAVSDIPYIIQFIDYLKSSSVSQTIKGKSIDLQKLFKYYNGTTTSVPNVLLLSYVVLPIIFALYLLLSIL